VRSSKNHLLRILGIVGAVIVLGAGIATATEGGESEDPEVAAAEVDCEDEGAAAEHPDECTTDDDEVDCTDEANADDPACVDDEEATEDDEVDCDDEANAEDATCAAAEATDDDEGDGPEEGTHGFVVSQAAKDHSHDERCGNHGAYVSSVARGLDDCEVPPGLQRKMADADADDDDADEAEVETTQVRPNGGGRPDHAGPPAGRGGRG
jgi:hypothetical protein